MPAMAYTFALLLLTGSAAISDAKTGLIPNRLTLPVLAFAPLAQGLGGGSAALMGSLLAALGCALVPLLLFTRGAMGGGDLKLFAAVGALVGVQQGLLLQVLSYALAASGALIWLGLRGELGAVLASSLRLLLRRKRKPGGTADAEAQLHSIRLGPAVFAASLVLGWRAALGG